MAGDWIKMRTCLHTERAVMLICEHTGLDSFSVVGRLHALWSWAGEQTSNGVLRSVTPKMIDTVTCHKDFFGALLVAQWIERDENGDVHFPQWKKHNSKSARIRHLAAERQAKHRAKMSRKMSRSERDASVTVTHLEKRREEKNNNTPLTPQTGGSFDQFWSAYPRKVNKAKASAAWVKLNPSPELVSTIIEAVTVWAKSEQWTKDGGQFIPHAATWINGRRWEDETPKSAKPAEAWPSWAAKPVKTKTADAPYVLGYNLNDDGTTWIHPTDPERYPPITVERLNSPEFLEAKPCR